jgi:hypothetical protein
MRLGRSMEMLGFARLWKQRIHMLQNVKDSRAAVPQIHLLNVDKAVLFLQAVPCLARTQGKKEAGAHQ